MSLNDGLFKFPTCHVSTSVLEVVKLVQNTIKEALEVKGQLISECLFDILNFPKKQQKNGKYSAPESKKWSNQQNKGTFL